MDAREWWEHVFTLGIIMSLFFVNFASWSSGWNLTVVPEYSSKYGNGALKREQLKSRHKKRCRKTSPNIYTDGQTKPMRCTRVNLKQRSDTAFLPVSLCLNLYENVIHNTHESPLRSREFENKRRSARLISSPVLLLTNKMSKTINFTTTQPI